MLLLVIVAIKHNLIQVEFKGDDLPPPAAEIRAELNIPLFPELLLLLLGRRVVPTVRTGANSVQTASYVLLEGLDVGVGQLIQGQLAGGRSRKGTNAVREGFNAFLWRGGATLHVGSLRLLSHASI